MVPSPVCGRLLSNAWIATLHCERAVSARCSLAPTPLFGTDLLAVRLPGPPLADARRRHDPGASLWVLPVSERRGRGGGAVFTDRGDGAAPVCYKYRAVPGGIAQMGERRVRIAQARGSSPLTSTSSPVGVFLCRAYRA